MVNYIESMQYDKAFKKSIYFWVTDMDMYK